MRTIFSLVIAMFTSVAFGSIVDYGPPQDLNGNWQVDWFNPSGLQMGTSSTPVRTDPTGTTTQPISASSLPLPTGAATSANQTATQPRNITQFGGNNISTGTGASGVGIPRVTVSNDSNILCTESGTWTVQQGSTPTAIANAWPFKLTDGTNTTAVKAASTAAAASDPSVVVALSPNSPIPSGSNTIGALTANQSVNVNQIGGTSVVTAGVSGLQAIGGNIASGSADSGNPVKVGGVYNSTLPTLTSGNRGDEQVNHFGEQAIAYRNTYRNIVGATTVTVKSGAGYLHTICQNTTGNSETITVYDNTAGSGTKIATITPSQAGRCSEYDVEFTTGLTIVQTATASDTTVNYH